MDLFVRNEMERFNAEDLSILTTDYHQNPIIALLKGPDTRYEQILMNENEQFNVPVLNRDKNAFLQIHVRKFIV